MRKRLSALSLAAGLLLIPTADVSAQTTTAPVTEQESDDDGGDNLGWLGLLGLAGLAGLLPRRARGRDEIGSRSIRDPEPPRSSGH